eukprot:CAMPEP_0197825578 /NCGR_PEP_ID=MMETSP1437-20131217/2623_1 /TAXON_ID=49252 ORGANISM="Eucampia antarctica, Strain CCMP1452" /NCGR_SAMPLE_ID=MMETSP1437 /ASSEMBLY_ACC=CAM_ASM_001096 /LENGTH=344 /DNA_ID=CAMNT_0043425621 /DNA_START=81 /DNA_END=1115 /DNA_ORIENTATION=+
MKGPCIWNVAVFVCMIAVFGNNNPSSIALAFSSTRPRSHYHTNGLPSLHPQQHHQQHQQQHQQHQQRQQQVGTNTVASSQIHYGSFRLYSSKQENDNDDDKAVNTAAMVSDEERILKEEEEKKKRLKEGEIRRKKMTDELEKEKRTNIGVAVFSFLAAVLNYGYQLLNPVTELQLLVSMQDQSSPLTYIGHNGKPTVVDFWAPWCDNCKSFAPTLQSIEKEYADRVNFVMINGDEGANWPLINRFGVDAIPHLALISADGTIETALIGPVPKSVMSTDLNVLLQNANNNNNNNNNNNDNNSCPPQDSSCHNTNKDNDSTAKIELPYTMFDAFRNRPELRHVSFD